MSSLSSIKPDQAGRQEVFLLNPANHSVLDGETQRNKPRPRRSYWWISIFVSLVVFSGLLEWTDLYLRASGHPILATVVSRHTDTYSDKNGEHTNYLVTYRFVLPEHDKTYLHESTIDADIYNLADANSPLRVVYDPNSPDTSDTLGNVMKVPIFTLASLLFAIVGGGIYGYKWLRLSRLRRKGTVIRTKLGSFTAAKGRGKRNNYYDLEFGFTFYAPDGDSVSTTVKDTLTKKEFAARHFPEPSTPIALLYLDAKHFALL